MRYIKLFLLIFSGIILTSTLRAQVTTDPFFPSADQPMTIIYDATQGSSGLVGAAKVFMHAGVILSGPDGTSWQHVIGAWGNPASPGEMTSLGNNKWSITITPRTYFQPAGLPANVPVYRIGMVFREAGPCGGFNGNNTECQAGRSTTGSDIFVDLTQGGFDLRVTAPTQFPIFKNAGEVLTISAAATHAADLSITINGSVKKTLNGTQISYDHTVAETGKVTVVVKGNDGAETREETFTYFVRTPTVVAPRPAGIVDGINYHAGNQTKVTLSLWAPTKTSATSSVYVVGDFSNWEVLSQCQMKRDGEHYWIELTGLTPQQEYAFQYLVNETLWIADPYSDKVLDPNDQYIPEATYPGLRDYPQVANHGVDYFNRLSTFQTGQAPYNWNVDNFQKPAKKDLVVYELLIRDYFENGERNYQNLIDTLSYLKRLGVNAIELMPVTEFNGNESWGYNPAFMFAPDKYYGTRNKLKEFIDRCHQEGIAVILDMVMNHQDLPNSYLMMDFDFGAGRPTAENKWFNQVAQHPYNVFSDMNHESTYTQAYLDTITYYWINEYKFDGYRFDLSKGMTQNTKCAGSTSDESCFASYDASRVAILKRMADAIWSHTPDAYVILEHFAENSEEKELAEYRSNEGKGMMFWGNLNYAYSQNSMGQSSGNDIGWVYHGNRGWSVPHVVGYMESHDEERMMYRNITFGNSSGSYNVRTLSTALDRAKAAAAFFFTIPGPKMIWQFEELGYDVSIDFNGRIGVKPLHWEYLDSDQRMRLFETFRELIHLKKTYDVFSTTDVTISGSTLSKQLLLKNVPYSNTPTSTDDMNVVVIGNFNVTAQSMTVTFPHTGNWFLHFSQGDTLKVASFTNNINLQPGEFRVYTDVKLPLTEPELNPFVSPLKPALVSLAESNSKINITWTDNSMIEQGYKIYRKKAGEAYALIATTAKNVTSYSDNQGLVKETEYFYYVEAFNPTGASRSEEDNITTTPGLITSEEREIPVDYVAHPNPTDGKLMINQRDLQDIKLFDSRGIERKVQFDGHTIDISEVPKGMYVLKFRNRAGRAFVQKVIRE